MNPLIVSPTAKCEQALASYLSSSLQASASVFTGLDNQDKINPPCVIINCKDASEVYFNTRNYRFDVDISVREIAFDDSRENFSSVAGNVAAYFSDSATASAAMNSYFSSSHQGINLYQVQITGYNQAREGDAWHNNFTYAFIGALTSI